jgi:tetratricopeptide (TPR) repeat protein
VALALAQAAPVSVSALVRAIAALTLVVHALVAPPLARAQQVDDVAPWRERMLAGAGTPDEWDAYAHALYRAGRYRESVGAFQRAIQLGASPPDSGSWNVARAYALAGDSRQAFRWMERALDLGFRDRRAMREEPAFERYRGAARFRELVYGVPVSRRRSLARSVACPVHCARLGNGVGMDGG